MYKITQNNRIHFLSCTAWSRDADDGTPAPRHSRPRPKRGARKASGWGIYSLQVSHYGKKDHIVLILFLLVTFSFFFLCRFFLLFIFLFSCFFSSSLTVSSYFPSSFPPSLHLSFPLLFVFFFFIYLPHYLLPLLFSFNPPSSILISSSPPSF